MSKGPKIKDSVKWRIYQEAIKNRAEPRDAVAERIEQFLEDKEFVPSRDTLVKMISSARNRDDPEDRPWTVSALADYEIPPEALPVVMDAWTNELELDRHLTIRQAKWIARLYYALKHEDTHLLCAFASGYASVETVTRPTGKYPEKPEDAWSLWLHDAQLYLNMRHDDRPYRKCREHAPAEWLLVDSTTFEIQRGSELKEEDTNERSHSQEG